MAIGSRKSRIWPHIFMIAGLLIVFFPVWMAFVASTHTLKEVIQYPSPVLPGTAFFDNYWTALTEGYGTFTGGGTAGMGRQLFNSLVMALGISIGKISISIIAAYAIVFFRFPLRMFAFWMIFMTLMLPVEVRILPTYKVVASLGMLDSYSGLILPLIASATATFLFRQIFLTIPDEMVESAKVDGVSALRFFWDFVLPLSRNNIAALFVILFIYGWNQFLWPLIITNDPQMSTAVMGIGKVLNVGDDQAPWHLVMTSAMLAMIPPILVVIFMQKQFVRGLVEQEK